MKIKGTEELKRLLKQLGGKARAELGKALYTEGQLIRTDSMRQCPVDTGTLRGTAYIEQPKYTAKSIIVEIGYGGPAAPYAVYVHENPRAGKTGGKSPSGKRYKTWAKVGKWKYLEDPAKAAAPEMPRRIAARLREVMR